MTRRESDYPFAAIVGQDMLKLAIILCAVDHRLGGVLALGDRGTGKTTAVRALASLLPQLDTVKDCPYHCDPSKSSVQCDTCGSKQTHDTERMDAPVVDLPLGVTEDRLLGALDLERALIDGVKQFEPGLLAKANRGFLYIDEVNLLEDHLVDVLLDVAASGWNMIEREGMSVKHPSRFVLVGSGNPEEGELRPQLLDRFGLSVDVETPGVIKDRVEIIKRRDAYDRDPVAFVKKWKQTTSKLSNRIKKAQALLESVEVEDHVLQLIAEICIALGTDGLRGELTLIKASRAHAAWRGEMSASIEDVRVMAPLALSHRLRRNPLDDARGSVRVERALGEIFSKRDAA
ncbi:MAG: magnesium chelatase ATPase subunit I [Rhizobiaceae bacterium]|nr:magnesium chelatase ATPase subunit I [Rhizobiaceae bacterium]